MIECELCLYQGDRRAGFPRRITLREMPFYGMRINLDDENRRRMLFEVDRILVGPVVCVVGRLCEERSHSPAEKQLIDLISELLVKGSFFASAIEFDGFDFDATEWEARARRLLIECGEGEIPRR